MGQLSSSGLCTRSGSAVAVRQGALQLRDLHEDTTGPGQVWGERISLPHSCVLTQLVLKVDNIPVMDVSLCSDSATK